MIFYCTFKTPDKTFSSDTPSNIVFSKNTLDSSPCAKDKAHKRR